MTRTATNTGAALDIALAYHEAWTSHDLDTAMAYVAEDITCVAPGATITGVDAYRQFLGGFTAKLTGVETTAAYGDETTAVLFYYPHTEATRPKRQLPSSSPSRTARSPAARWSSTGRRSLRRRTEAFRCPLPRCRTTRSLQSHPRKSIAQDCRRG